MSMGKEFSNQALSMVATALSETYGVQVRANGSAVNTVFAHGKPPLINIPAMEVNEPDYHDLIRGFIDHEVGHVRFTQRGAGKGLMRKTHDGKQTLDQTMLNIFEDVFVERKMGGYFPGCKRNLRRMTNLLFSGDRRVPPQVIEPGEHASEEMAAQAITQHVLYQVRGDMYQDIAPLAKGYRTALDNMYPGLADRLDPVLQDVPNSQTTQDNADKAARAMQVVREYLQEPPQEEGGGGGGDENKQQDPQDQQQDGGGNQQQDQQPPPPAPSGPDKQDMQKWIDGGGKVDAADTSVGDAIQQAIGDITENAPDAVEPQEVNVKGEGDNKHNLSELSTTEKRDAERAAAMLDTQLQALMQTEVLSRRGIGQAGKLDHNLVHRLAVNNPRVFRRRIDRKEINTEVVLCVDMSGSMDERGKDVIASKALYALTKSLRKINGIKSSAIGFDSGDIISILAPGEAMHTRMRIRPGGGTLCGEALIQALHNFSTDRDSRKVVIMLTDGESHNHGFFAHAIKVVASAGIEFIGVGIQDNAIERYLPACKCTVVKDLNKLAPELFRILRQFLLGAA